MTKWTVTDGENVVEAAGILATRVIIESDVERGRVCQFCDLTNEHSHEN